MNIKPFKCYTYSMKDRNNNFIKIISFCRKSTVFCGPIIDYDSYFSIEFCNNKLWKFNFPSIFNRRILIEEIRKSTIKEKFQLIKYTIIYIIKLFKCILLNMIII